MKKIGINPSERINEYNKYVGMVYKPIQTEQQEIPQIASLLSGEHDSPLIPKPKVKQKEEPVEEEIELNSIDNVLKDVPYNNETVVEAPAEVASTSSYDSLKALIKKNESGSKGYAAYNPNTGYNGSKGSGAWGAYQFIWSKHKDPIKKITGISDPEDFLNSPEAQETYFDYYLNNELLPSMLKFKEKYPASGLTDEQIIEGMHFRGPAGFNKQYREGTFYQQTESNNPSVAARLKL